MVAYLAEEGVSFDEFADDVGGVGVEVGVEDLGGAEGCDSLGGGDLFGEAGFGAGVVFEVGADGFDGDAVAAVVLAEVDDALAAGAEASEEAVGACGARVVSGERRGVRCCRRGGSGQGHSMACRCAAPRRAIESCHGGWWGGYRGCGTFDSGRCLQDIDER